MSIERMKALVTIVSRGDGFALSKLFAQYDVPLHFQMPASGTASSELLSMLGLAHREKDLMIGLGPASAVEALLSRLDDDYRGILSVRGLAFSLSLTAVSGFLAAALSRTSPTPEGGSAMPSEKEYSLIFAFVNQGYTDPVMQTACKAGATGGTVVRGRWVGTRQIEQFHGVTLQDEKEILMIACPKEKRNAIMDAITQDHGIQTPEQAMVCSLPIDRMVRLA